MLSNHLNKHNFSHKHILMLAAALAVVVIGYLSVPVIFGTQNVEAGRTCCNPANMSQCTGCGSTETKNDNECFGAPGCINCGSWVSNFCCLPGECAPPCTNSAPGVAVLSTPANSAVNVDLPVNFSWTNSTGWGTNCAGNNNTFTVYAGVRSGGTCAGVTYTAYATVPSNQLSASVGALQWGTGYCWFVRKSNGAAIADSTIFQFNTTTPPQVSNFTITNPNLCGPVPISGRTDSPNANNPITISIDFTDPNTNFGTGTNRFDSLRIAVIPTSQQNSNVVPFSVLDPILRNRLGFRANVTGATTFSAIDSVVSPYFGSPASIGNLTNAAATATLLSLNNATSVQQVGNQTLHVTWQIRFENTFPTADDNIYIAAIVQTPSGNLISQDAQGTGATLLQYRRASTWETDMTAPDTSVSAPVAISTDTFTLKWTATDSAGGNNGLRDLRSYCYVDANPTNIFDQTLGQMIPLGSSPLSYPSAGNCLVSANTLGTHAYTLNNLANTSDMHFALYAEDGACNPATQTSQLDSPAAWIVTSKGVTSAAGGYSGFKVRNIANLSGIVPNLADDSFLSTYAAISGNASMLSQLQSKHNFYTTDYDDKGVLPPEISDADNWFDYLYQLVSTRQTVSTSTITTINGSVAGTFGAGFGDTLYVLVNNNLTVASGSHCDANAAIFINGNLTIQPDFTKINEFVGCAFVVKGNVTIDVGTTKSAIGSGQPAKYDVVEGAFISDGIFSTNVDQSGAVSSWSTGASTAVRGYHSMVGFNDKLYAWGGFNGAAILNSLSIYDTTANTWSSGTTGGTPRYLHTAVVYNGKMYAWGGYGAAGKMNTMDIYDFATGTWSVGPTGGTARYGHTAVVQGDKMYVWGGETAANVRINTVDIFNFTTNTWSVGTTGGAASIGAAAAVVNNKMYVWGGSAGNVTSVFNFATNTWSAGTTAGSTRSYASAVLFSNKIFIWGGIDTAASNRVDIYDSSVPQWTYGANGGTARYVHAAVAMNGKMYAFGGANASGVYIGTLDIYDFGSAVGGDGLYIRGTVYASELNLQRNLGIAQNGLQPAEVFDYDPAYVRIFRSIFGIRTFSLRAR